MIEIEHLIVKTKNHTFIITDYPYSENYCFNVDKKSCTGDEFAKIAKKDGVGKIADGRRFCNCTRLHMKLNERWIEIGDYFRDKRLRISLANKMNGQLKLYDNR